MFWRIKLFQKTDCPPLIDIEQVRERNAQLRNVRYGSGSKLKLTDWKGSVVNKHVKVEGSELELESLGISVGKSNIIELDV